MSYWNLLQLTLPVFALIAIGVAIRRVGWVQDVAEASFGNAAMRTAGNLLLPPLLGFVFTSVGVLLALYTARTLGVGQSLNERPPLALVEFRGVQGRIAAWNSPC